ncbi:MAG: DUF2271 domain-containing protein [Tahibacter sp.]
MRTTCFLAFTGLIAGSAVAADLTVSVELATIDVAEYHRPYVAVWIEGEDQAVAANLAVWYQQNTGKGEGGKVEQGSKWLADLRQWWRRSGRSVTLPIDTVSGATRPAGVHRLEFSDAKPPLAGVAAGNYKVVVEVAREVGGHELLRMPLQWPPNKPVHAEARGEHELGLITLDLNP